MSTVALQTIQEPEAAQMSESGAVVQLIDRASRDPTVNIEKMRELLAMRREMMAFEAERSFDAAMTTAQTAMRPVSVDANNPQTRSRYASYHALDGAIRPVYTEHGFSLSFGTADGAPQDHIRITCRIAHNGGHREVVHLDMPADGKGAKGGDVMTKTHATGAAITYGRRYLLGMIFNIAVSQDNDGNGVITPAEPKFIDKAQFDHIVELIKKAGTTEAKLCEWLRVPQLEHMDQTKFKMADAALKKKISQGAK